MTPLSSIHYTVNNTDSTKVYHFSVCSSVNDPCLEGVGSCVVDSKTGQSTQIGKNNTDLKVDSSGQIYLQYNDGSRCDGNKKRTTRIQFICINGDQKEDRVLIEDTECETLIHFNTKYACPKNDYCKTRAPDGIGEINLEVLIKNHDNYVANINKTNFPNEKSNVRYILNVCRPLVSKYSLNCQGAACKTELQPNGKHEFEIVSCVDDFLYKN